MDRERFTAFLYVYVDDADAAHARALAAGAVTLGPPLDTPYGVTAGDGARPNREHLADRPPH